MTSLQISYSGFNDENHFLMFKKWGVATSKSESASLPFGMLGLQIKKNGILRQLNLEYQTLSDARDIKKHGVIYGPLFSAEMLKQLKLKMDEQLDYRIYYICHTFLDIRYEYDRWVKHGIDTARVTFIAANALEVTTVHSRKTLCALIPEAAYNEILEFYPEKPKPAGSSEKKNKKINFFFLMAILKFLLAPGYFMVAQINKLRVNNFIWLLRTDELFSFLHYIFNFVFVKIFVDANNRSKGAMKVGSIKAFFLVRHVILMGLFKAYGFFVDGLNFISRYASKLRDLLKVGFIRLGYSLRHLLLMMGFKSFGVVVDAFYFVRFLCIKGFYQAKHWLITGIQGIYFFFKVSFIRLGYLLRHVVIMAWVKIFYPLRHFLTMGWIRSYYSIRHIILMATFKSYGLLVDAYYAIIRVLNFCYFILIKKYFYHILVQKYLLFPFFKIYWFTSYQYKKRIKKEIV